MLARQRPQQAWRRASQSTPLLKLPLSPLCSWWGLAGLHAVGLAAALQADENL